MRVLALLPLLVFSFSCSKPTESNSSTPSSVTITNTTPIKGEEEEKIIPLKNHYSLTYFTDEEYKHLRLKGPSLDTVIWSISAGLPDRNMGHLEADFDKYFVLYAHFGNGYNEMLVIEKKSGTDIAYGSGIKIDTIQNIIYFEDKENLEKLSLLNLNTLKKEAYPIPKGIKCENWYNCIENIKLTDKELSFEYITTENQKKVQVYKR